MPDFGIYFFSILALSILTYLPFYYLIVKVIINEFGFNINPIVMTAISESIAIVFKNGLLFRKWYINRNLEYKINKKYYFNPDQR